MQCPIILLFTKSREVILDALTTINKCEFDIPTTEQELKDHNHMCTTWVDKMRATLKIMEGDIEIVTAISKMTDAEKRSFVELSLIRCEDPCTENSFVTFNHESLNKEASQLQSSTFHKLMHDSILYLFTGIESLGSVEFLQLDSHQAPVINIASGRTMKFQEQKSRSILVMSNTEGHHRQYTM